MDPSSIYSNVNEHYSAAVRVSNTGRNNVIAKAFGYSEEELGTIPKDANLGLSCGNPLAITTLREGETVIDLGSGAGLDIFLAASKVGLNGKAIGVDMNKDMLDKARQLCEDSGKPNIQFVESSITTIALPSGTADCIISNCVVNLVPEAEKQFVFNEMFRLLRPGGRVAISDILAKKPLTEAIKQSMSLYIGCIAGASQVEDYRRYFEVAGFKDILITDTASDLNVYLEPSDSSGCSSAIQGMRNDLQGQNLNDWAGSFKIYAVKASATTV